GFGQAAYFCEDCPFKDGADDVIIGALTWTYGVGLNRKGAAGALEDAGGNYSKPVDLPFKGKQRPDYWPERSTFLDIDQQGAIEAVRKCEGPEVSKTRILRREVNQ